MLITYKNPDIFEIKKTYDYTKLSISYYIKIHKINKRELLYFQKHEYFKYLIDTLILYQFHIIIYKYWVLRIIMF